MKAKFRKALTDRYEKLDPTLQARCKNFFKRRPDEKRAALEKLEGVAKVMPTIDMLKKTARDFEQKKDFPEALKFYREALRLDPDDEWSKVKVQSLSLKLGISKTPEKTKKGEETEEAVDTKKVEGKIENIIDLHGEDVERLRDLRAAYHEMQKSSEVLGAHGTETERSAKLRAQKEFELKGGKGEEESAILEKLYTEDREAIIDTEGKLGKKHVVRHQKGVDAEGLRMLGQELRVEHKTDINRGRADIEFRQADGRQLSVKETHTFNNREFEIQVDAMTARLLMDLKQDRKQGEARIREMMEEKLRREVRSKAA